MAIFRKKDVVILPFPFTDLSQTKLRPCLVLSDEMKDDILVCQITSRLLPSDNYTVELSKKDGLEIESYIRCNMLFTTEKYKIKRKIAQISNKTYNEVIQKIKLLIS